MPIKLSLATIAGVGALALAGAAAAQPAVNWKGAYVGVLVGAKFGSGDFSLPGDKADVLKSSRASDTAFDFGGLVGFNTVVDGVLLGVEGDITDPNNTRSVVACNVADGCFTPAHDSFTTYNNLKETLNGRVRARVGLVRGDNLFYVGVGYSVAETRLDLVGDCYNPANPPVPTLYTFSRSKTISGYNVGGGVEHALGSHLLVRAEYIYDDYGDQTYAGSAEWNDRRISVHDSNVRVGLSYRF